MALARLLLCEGSPGSDGLFGEIQPAKNTACGRCESCIMMDSGMHPDFHPVYKELARFHPDTEVRNRKMQGLSVGVIRHFVIEPARQKPVGGIGKIFLVHEAELLSTGAQNALLKTLEEPPEGVRLILLCQNPDLLLPTTRSRCSIYRFGPLEENFIVTRLAEEGVGETEGRFWAAFTGGSLGESLELANDGMYEIKTGIVNDIAGVGLPIDADLSDKFKKITDKLSEKFINKVKKQHGVEISALLARRKIVSVIIRIIASLLHVSMVSLTSPGRSPVNADQPEAVRSVAARMDTSRLSDALGQLSELETFLWRNVNPKTVWDNILLTCSTAASLNI